MNEPALVIGCGSGRCGTMSLARLLAQQRGSLVTHERYGPDLTHDRSHQLADELISERAQSQARLVGDVQGSWIWYANYILEACEHVRLICLHRPMDETVDSIMAKKSTANKWQQGRGRDERWDETCPYYADHLEKREAVARYWRDVYGLATEMCFRYPERFRIYSMERVLNTREGQEEMLRGFIGLEDAVYDVGITKNARAS